MKKFLKCLLTIVGIFCILSSNLRFVYAATSPFSQTDWSGGSGQSSFTDNTRYDSGSNIKDSTAGEISIAATSGWYNSSWSYRKKITFDNSAQAENLIDFPVLVKLTTSNTDYSKFKAAGADIRFTDSNGTTALSYEIESWNASGDSFVWVKVPQIDASSTTDSVYMYYGNSAASDAQDASNTWNSNYSMVQHLKETAACPTTFDDSTSNNNDGSCTNTPVTGTGQIDGARVFATADADDITVPDAAAFTNSTMTMSIWANQSSLSTAKALIAKWEYNAAEGGWALQSGPSDNTRLQFFMKGVVGDPGDTWAMTPTSSWSTGWHQVVITYDAAGTGDSGKLKMYIDGVAQTLSFNQTMPSSVLGSAATLKIGQFGGALDRPWNGSLDEVRMSTNIQSAAWIAASYKSEANTFNTLGSEETQYPTSASLTSSIFDTEGEATWGNVSFSATTPSGTTATVKVRTSNNADMSGATTFSTCNTITNNSDISSNNCVTDGQRYVQYRIDLGSDGMATPTFTDIAIAFTTGSPAPSAPPSSPPVYHPPSSTEVPVCGLSAPTSAPSINKQVSGETSVDLFFSKVDGADQYVVSYGYDSNADNFGATFGGGSDSVLKQTIGGLKSGTSYYFKVRGGNGCASGPWSSVTKVSTTGSFSGVLVSAPKAKESSPSSKLITKASPIPTPMAIVSASPVPSQGPLIQLPQAPKINLSFFIPKFDFSFFGGLGQGLASLGNSVTTPIAALYQDLFEPEELMITEVKVAEKGKDFAVVTWKTNIPATSKVNYGDSYDYGKDFQSMEKVLEHRIILVGLEEGKTYFYEVMSQAGGSYSFDARHEFKLE